jgi:hypothetical protein
MRSRELSRTRFNEALTQHSDAEARRLFAAFAFRAQFHISQSPQLAHSPYPAPFTCHGPCSRNCFGIPNMFQRLRFVTRATSTPVFPSTLNRQR